jgi:hypothetical protein
MNTLYLKELLRERIASFALGIFLWALEYENVQEFYAEIVENARREAQSEKNSVWFTK